jgi:demethylmenaquinone methyltransferase/2-methoxy-6-polyprenyl-1,4-benzoquinol methylase
MVCSKPEGPGQYTVEGSILTSPIGKISRAQTRENYDRMARWYDLFASSEKKFTEIGLDMVAVRVGEKVLEIGSGTGHALVELAHSAGHSGLACGLELSPGMIAIAHKLIRAKSPESSAKLLNGDAGTLPFRDGAFDGVFLSFTLELFADLEIPVILGECRRVLKPGGRIGVVAMARSNSLACRMYEWGHRQWPALLDCRPIALRRWLEESNYTIEKTSLKKMWGLPVEIVLGRPA